MPINIMILLTWNLNVNLRSLGLFGLCFGVNLLLICFLTSLIQCEYVIDGVLYL